MAIPDVENYIPQNDDMLSAFDVVKDLNRKHAGLTTADIRSADIMALMPTLAFYFKAGMGFLANRGHDKVIRDIGEYSWRSVSAKRTSILVTDNIPVVAAASGATPEQINGMIDPYDPGKISFLPMIFRRISGVTGGGFVFVPPEFAGKANYEPIEALANLVSVCSQIKDAECGRINSDYRFIPVRAYAAEAHFMLEAQRRYPNHELTPYHRSLMEEYPRGYDGLHFGLKYPPPGIGFNNPLEN